jgi:hypothetical protein
MGRLPSEFPLRAPTAGRVVGKECIRTVGAFESEDVAQDEHGESARRQELKGGHERQRDGFSLLVASLRADRHGEQCACRSRRYGSVSPRNASPSPAREFYSAVTTLASPSCAPGRISIPVWTPAAARTGRSVTAHFPHGAVSASSMAPSIPNVDGWRRSDANQLVPRAEFRPSVSTHEVGGCDHPGTGKEQR